MINKFRLVRTISVILICFFLSTNTNGQSFNCFSFGYDLMKFKSDDFQLSVNSTSGYYVSFEVSPKRFEFFGVGLEYRSNIFKEDVSFWDLKLKLALLLLKKERLQYNFQVMIGHSFFDDIDVGINKNQDLSLGFKLGTRIYMTGKISLELSYSGNLWLIDEVNGIVPPEDVTYSVGNRSFAIGIGYTFEGKKRLYK